MAVQNGRDLLIKIDMNGQGRSRRWRACAPHACGSTPKASMSPASKAWAAGASFCGAGCGRPPSPDRANRDAATDEQVRQMFFDGLVPAFQVVIPVSAPSRAVQITGIDYSSYNGEAATR